MKFKKIIQAEMESSDLNKGQLSQLFGISKVTLDSYLSGATSPAFDVAVTMLDKLKKKVFIVDLYGDDEYFLPSQKGNHHGK